VPKRSGKNLKLALVGSSGRMGTEITQVAAGEGVEVTVQLDKGGKWKINPGSFDVMIDFSLPEGTREALKWCVENGKPLVSGTTGLTEKDHKAFAAAGKTIPVLYSANMSLGIAVVSAMLDRLKAVSEWDFQIDEVHHKQKKDKPSGTALLLDAKLSQVLGRKLPPPNSIRGGGVPGIHQVWAMGQDEVVVLQHTAFNRRVFARGAVHAARWLFDKDKPGFYNLSDLYN
jgi:4-hydroxy-tetrahydrodipicolinate reductase